MKSLLWLVLSLCALVAPRAHAEGEATAALHARVDGTDVRLALEIKVPFQWYVASGPTLADAGQEGAIVLPTKLTVSGVDATFGPWRFPKPDVKLQEFSTPPVETYVHHGTFTVYRRGKLAAGASIDALKVEINGQTCKEGDEGICVPWRETLGPQTSGGDALFAAFPKDLAASEAAAVEAPKSEATKPPSREVDAKGSTSRPSRLDDDAAGAESSLFWFVLQAVLWGLVTLLMPCTYPMIPITISYFTKQAEKRKTSTLPLSLAYGAGIVLIFVLIGLFFGPVITRFATHPITNIVLGVAFVYFALVLFGMVNLQPPAFLMNVAGSASQKGGYLGVFLMGATLVVTSFTCTAPFVGTLLSTSGSSGSLGRVALGMGVFGLTMAVPFVFLSLVPSRARSLQGTAGEWMKTLKVYLGFVELAASLKFFSQAEYAWQLGYLPRELFLALTLAILFAAAAYLFGWIRMRDELGQEDSASISPKRMLGGLVNLCLAAYCAYGMLGNRLDPVLSSYVPPYSNRIENAASGATTSSGPTIVKDDFDAAVAAAIREKKQLLVNFTGFT